VCRANVRWPISGLSSARTVKKPKRSLQRSFPLIRRAVANESDGCEPVATFDPTGYSLLRPTTITVVKKGESAKNAPYNQDIVHLGYHRHLCAMFGQISNDLFVYLLTSVPKKEYIL
jgi:hypothetical protein